MNGRERIAAALAGETLDVAPVMLHNFMMAAREAGVSMREFRGDGRTVARCLADAAARYGYDGIVLDVDTATLAGALGVPVDYPDDAPARCAGARLRSLEEVDGLAPVDLSRDERVQVWLEAARVLRSECGGEVWIRGNCDQAPYSLAACLRGPDAWMMDLMDPAGHARAHALLEYTSRATAQFLELMAATGVDMLSNGDSFASPDLVSPRVYREFAWPYEVRMAEKARQLGKPWVLHICGRTDAILERMAATGAAGIEIDYRTDVALARAACGSIAFIGNLDPSGVLALGTPALVEEKTRELRRAFAGVPRFILNSGCAIPAHTPPENLRALMRAAREPL